MSHSHYLIYPIHQYKSRSGYKLASRGAEEQHAGWRREKRNPTREWLSNSSMPPSTWGSVLICSLLGCLQPNLDPGPTCRLLGLAPLLIGRCASPMLQCTHQVRGRDRVVHFFFVLLFFFFFFCLYYLNLLLKSVFIPKISEKKLIKYFLKSLLNIEHFGT